MSDKQPPRPVSPGVAAELSPRYSGMGGMENVNGVGRPPQRDSLLDLLDRVLDKGVVIAGDISINLLDIELLTIKIRLLIASADKAKEMGIDWWTHDPSLSSKAGRQQQKVDAERENRELRERISALEARLNALGEAPDQARSRPAMPPGGRAGRGGQ